MRDFVSRSECGSQKKIGKKKTHVGSSSKGHAADPGENGEVVVRRVVQISGDGDDNEQDSRQRARAHPHDTR